MVIISLKTNMVLEKNFSIYLENGRSVYLYVLFKSRSMLLVNGEYVPVEPGTGIFYDKNKPQGYYGCDVIPFNHDFILFDLENEFERCVFMNIPLGIPHRHLMPEALSKAISDIESERSSESRYGKEILSNLSMNFLYKALNDLNFTYSGKRDYYRKFYEIRTEIYLNPEKAWSIDEISSRLAFSRVYYQHVYKKIFGVSCVEDVIRARIRMSKNFLTGTNLTVSEIAELCGYNSTEHFIRQFVQRVGVTPNRYRNHSASIS